MTLFRQIAIFVSILFLILAGSILWSSLLQYTQYTQGQIQSTADDMATNLGVTIANTVDGSDVAAIETLFNTIFDSGYYARLELESPQGDLISSRKRPVIVRDVPQWFVDALPLQPATGITTIMQGWAPLGTLRITLHPGFAYAGMYDTLRSLLLWLALILPVGLLLLWQLLRLLLRPLDTLEHQAEAVEENRFYIQKKLPKTRELRHVSATMNRMVRKMESIFNEQARTLSLYHDALYKDAASGLANRRFLMMQLEQLLHEESAIGGTLMLIKLHGIKHLMQEGQFALAEQTVHILADLAQEHFKACSHPVIARLGSADFAVIVDLPSENAESCCKGLFEAFSKHPPEREAAKTLWLCAGLTPLQKGRTPGEILARADFALAQAREIGPCAVVLTAPEVESLPAGKIEWRNWLMHAIEAHQFFLVGQPVFNHDESLLHYELFIRLRDKDGIILPAGRFMPVATSLGLDFAIEREVLRMAIEQAASRTYPIAINLSRKVLKDADALAEFNAFITEYARVAKTPLTVEISHASLHDNVQAATLIAQELKKHDFALAIDHFDFGGDLQLIQQLRPAYIKMNAQQLLEMADDPSPGALQPLQTLAKSMDIDLIAIGIDNEAMHQRLKQVSGIGFQGYLTGEPAAL